MAQQKPMPPTSEPPQNSSFQPNNWQSEDFIRALASLERLQNQLDQIRRIPSNLIAPFRACDDSPSQVFASFNAARQDSFKQIAEVRAQWEEPKTAQLFQQCNGTREKHVDLVQQYDIGIWGWVEQEQRRSEGSDMGGTGLDAAINGDGASFTNGANGSAAQDRELLRNSEEDEKTACALFGPEFEQFEWDDGTSTAQMVVKRPGPWLRFEVQRTQTVDGITYDARCVDETKEAESISRCLHKNVARNDIFETLETLLVHGDTTMSRADCENCGQYRDGTGMVPTARRRKARTKGVPSLVNDTAAWVALHESCL